MKQSEIQNLIDRFADLEFSQDQLDAEFKKTFTQAKDSLRNLLDLIRSRVTK